MSNFCIDCGKEVSYGPRCRSCAQKHKWKNPSEKQREQIKKAREVGATLPRSEKQIEHLKEMQEISATLPRSEKQIEANLENIKKAHKNLAKGIWQSSWEDKFYEMYLFPIFCEEDLRRQYYVKGLNHAFDFALPDFRVLIGIDGDYWHKDRKERDAKIDKFVEETDWTVYRYNDEDLKKLGVI